MAEPLVSDLAKKGRVRRL